MRLLASLLALLTWFPMAAPQVGSGGGYDALRTQAEARYAEKSFGLAHELYEQASRLELDAPRRRWVSFRLADTAWRSDSAAPSPDPTVREQARQALEELLRESGADHDRIWAEVNESLGDFHTTDRRYANPYQGQQYYLAALDWWAGSDDIPLARRRYLDLVWDMVRGYRDYGGGENASNVPRHVLVNAEQIAETVEEKAHARYLLAMQLFNDGQAAGVERGIELLEQLVRDGKATEWYDDALYQLAERYASNGAVVVLDNGETELRADFVKALELYRRLLAEAGSTSRYAQEARQAIQQITGTNVVVHAGSTFLPGSEQAVVLSWRNAKSIQLTLTAVDLPRDAVPGENPEVDWLDSLQTAGGKVVRRWTYETNDRGDHAPGNHQLRIAPVLEPGAYLLAAAAGSKTSRTLVLVTDAHILVHAAGDSLHVFVSDVITGQPLAGADVAVRYMKDRKVVGRTGQTDADGVARFELPDTYGSVIVAASKGMARQAYHTAYTMHHGRTAEGEWRIYAFTDRPAYRPEETVQWKIVARTRKSERWATPAGAAVTYEITDPRGQKVSSGTATLNAFGSFWGELALTKEMVLGVYTVSFRSGNRGIGGAQFFRLEEYKLPEFRVSVATPPGKQYRLGETIEATIEATYYFGGPVANATVEAVIYQEPFYRRWYPWRTYDWYYPPEQQYSRRQELRRETVRTDAEGRAVVRIETPRDGSETSYRIEARVVDASRREVVGSGSVKVLRQRYAVLAQPRHYVSAPNAATTVDFKALDANERPVQTTGTVTVVRRSWPPRRGKIAQPYADEDVLTTKLTTDAEGNAALTFTPRRAGYYLITWKSEDRDEGKPLRARDIVTATTTVWVADPSSVEIGYHASGLQIIVDKEAFRAGERAPVLIVTPESGRWVVLSSSVTSILETRVLRMDGTVKLVELALDERHVPNFFLTASSVFDRTIATETVRVVVPPVGQFLDVQVTGDRTDYEPRQEGTLTITTRDADGKPVPAEVAVAVSDEAVTAIEQDLAGDPRVFFYGETFVQSMRVSGSLQSQPYVKLVEMKNGTLVDERYAKEMEERDQRYSKGEGAAVGGGVLGGVAADAAAAPPPSPVSNAVAESITVTASAPVAQSRMAMMKTMTGGDARERKDEAGEPAVTVRSDFRSTAFWKPDVVTGSDGRATVKVKFPEALTTWRATARAITTGAQVGSGTSTAQTNLPLMVRLQAPRFFVAGDRATVSAVINNNTDAAMTVTPALEIEGAALTVDGQRVAPLTVPAHGEARADWTVIAAQAGPAKVRVTGRSGDRADAMEKTFRVYEHGIDKLVARSGRLRGDEALIRLDLPRERRATDLTVYLAPSLAGAMIDALPYLIEFPYGCTEQTMSRFLPAAVVARTLKAQGLDVSKRPEFRDLDAVTKASMARLYDFQHGDGSWGWWKESAGDAFMTAYVVWGFAVAKSAGLGVNDAAVNRAVSWLETQLPRAEGQPHDQAWILHATTAWRAQVKTKAGTNELRAFENAYKNREDLSAYSRALLALAAHRMGDAERARVLVRNLQDGVAIDRKPDQSVLIRGTGGAPETMATAHWGAAERFWWRWWEGPVETTAFVLQALLAIEPEHALVEPAMNWLVKNRRGARWHNTRDTAIAILTLNEVLRTERGAPATSYEVAVNGTVVAAKPIAPEDFLRGPIRVSIDAALVKDANEIRIRRGGAGSLYFSAEARFVSLEEPVTAAGNELFVRRDYYRLVPRPTLLKGVVYEKVPLRDGERVPSNERVEVVVTVETKNDYEYLLFEDLKPAGLEAVALQSGTPLTAFELRPASVLRVQPKPTEVRRAPAADQTNRSVAVYQELRDRNVALFIDKLPQGIWEIRYTLRAEVPGTYHALPLLGQAMYVPDIRANGEEVRVTVE